VANRINNWHKLEWHIVAVLYPTYQNVKRALRGMASEPDTISEDNIKDFMGRLTRPDTKYGFISMLLAGDYSFLTPSENRV
jgi:hypothetical protein